MRMEMMRIHPKKRNKNNSKEKPLESDSDKEEVINISLSPAEVREPQGNDKLTEH